MDHSFFQQYDAGPWQIKVDRPGTYRVFANIATIHDHPAYLVEIADQKITGSASQTSGWDNFQENQLGTVEINNKGVLTVAVRAKDKPSWKAINLNALRLEPVSK